MSDQKTTRTAGYLPVRDQAMPRYSYPATATANGSLTVRSCGHGTATKRSVLVNGHLAY